MSLALRLTPGGVDRDERQAVEFEPDVDRIPRVVPGRSETIIRSAWARVLMKVDLPVFGRPTAAIFITSSAGLAEWVSGSRSAMSL